jgi:hypothetical protein
VGCTDKKTGVSVAMLGFPVVQLIGWSFKVKLIIYDWEAIT